MKTSTLLKSLSAVGILGTTLFSVNAHADCASGITQSGAGWQSCVPTGGGNSSDLNTYYPADPNVLKDEIRKIDETPVVAYWFDKKTQQVGYKTISLGDFSSVQQQFENQCAKNNRDCYINYRLISHGNYHASPERCLTIYKQFVNRGGTGLFSKPKLVETYYQTLWDSPAEKVNTDNGIKKSNGTPVKDVCLN